ncbi:MAG: hypothetical protein Q9214_007591, partial [Letrouitia sp. 1 TL-2023]
TLLDVGNPVNVQSKPLRSTRAAAQIANRKIQKINRTESLAEEQLGSRQSPNTILTASNGQNGESLRAVPPTAQGSPSDITSENQTSNGYETAEIHFKRPVNQIMNDDKTSGIQVPRSSPFLPPEGTSRPNSSTKKETASQSNLNIATNSISHVSESNQTPCLPTNPPEEDPTILQDDEGMYFQDAMASYDASTFAHPSPSARSIASQKFGLATGMTPAKTELAHETSTEAQKHVAPIAQMQDSKEGHDNSEEPKRTLTNILPGPNDIQKLPVTDKMAGEQLKQTKTPLSTIAKDALTVLQPDQDQNTLIPEDVQEPHKPLKRPEKTQSFASCMKNALSEVSNTERLVGRRNRPAKTPSKLKTGQAPRNNTKVKFMPVNENGSLKNVKRGTEAPTNNSNGQRVALQKQKTNASQEKAIRLYKSALQLSDSESALDGRQAAIPDSNSYNTSHIRDVEKEYAIHRTPKQVQPQDIESPT